MTTAVVLSTAAAIVFGLWRLSLWLRPFAACRWCKGRRGRTRWSGRRAWDHCLHCGGKGERLRWGARDRK